MRELDADTRSSRRGTSMKRQNKRACTCQLTSYLIFLTTLRLPTSLHLLLSPKAMFSMLFIVSNLNFKARIVPKDP